VHPLVAVVKTIGVLLLVAPPVALGAVALL
jgi:hypothetical protein